MTHLLENWSKIPFAFGGAALSGAGGGYGFGEGDNPQDLLKVALERGVTLFDTAPIYGFGQSEEVLGEFQKGRRDQIRLISKSGVYWHSSKRVDMTNDPKITLKMFEESLRRLKTEYIDLYMIHWPDPKTDIRYPLEVIAKLKEQGKILEVGLCNTNSEDLKASEEVVDIRVVQSQHNIYEAPPQEVLTYITEKNLSFMGWGMFDKGILTGRVDKKREQAKDYDASDCRKNAPWWNQKDVLAKIDRLDFYKETAQKLGLSLSELAVNYALSPTWSSHALVGAKRVADLEAVLDAKRVEISDELRSEIEEKCRVSPS